jgi:hypothetical protein
MNKIKSFFTALKGYPSAIFGLIIVIALVVLSIYALIKIPYAEILKMYHQPGLIISPKRSSRNHLQ